MPKNFFRKIKESMMPTNNGGNKGNRSSDFERAKEVLFSAKTAEQLVSAVKYINNFNKKYRLGTKAPEFIYFDRMINVMKIKLRSKRFEVGDNPEDGERMDLRGRIKESLEDLDWIEQSETTFKPGFPFEGKEYWVDVTKIDREGREKIVNYIKKTIPNFKEFASDILYDISIGLNRGIIIHCASDRTDYEPEENMLCTTRSSYEQDYEIDNPYADISKSIYVDGQDILDYFTVVGDEEELDESLEWTDKDSSFDGKDKSFEADPTWTGDDDWAPNPDRSYWKQGDAGGSGGDVNESEEDPFKWMKDVEPDELSASPDVFFRSDDEMYYTLDQLGHDITNMEEITMCELAQYYGYRWSDKHEGWYHRDEVSDFRDLNESQDLDWIRDVSDQLPSYNQRTRIDLKDFLLDYAEDNLSVIDFLHNEDLYIPTDDYVIGRYTPEEWDEYGTDRWRDGDFKEHGQWIEDPWVTSWDLMEELEQGCSKWEFIERKTEDYDLERGSFDDLFIFKRKKDGRYFALGVRGDSYDGMNDNEDFLYEVFPRMKLVYESRKNLIKKILKEGDFDWLKDTRVHANYKGHPQGIVLLRDHQEIDKFCDIIDEYNGEIVDDARDWLHSGLEDRRDEIESMSAEDNYDYGEAVLSVSFFVEKRHPGKITLGYWPYDVTEDEWSIKDWLDGDYTFNRDYEIYNNLNQVEEIFKNYKNPNKINESDGWDWVGDSSFSEVERLNEYLKNNTDYYMTFKETDSDWAFIDIFKKDKRYPLMPIKVAQLRPQKNWIRLDHMLITLDNKVYNLKAKETRFGEDNKNQISVLEDFISVLKNWMKK